MHVVVKRFCPKPELPPRWKWVADRIARKDFAGLTQVQAVAIFEEQSRRMVEQSRSGVSGDGAR